MSFTKYMAAFPAIQRQPIPHKRKNDWLVENVFLCLPASMMEGSNPIIKNKLPMVKLQVGPCSKIFFCHSTSSFINNMIYISSSAASNIGAYTLL